MSVLCTSTEDRAIFCGTKSWFCRSFGCKCGMRVPFLQAILSWFNGGGLRSAAFSLPSLFLFLFQVGFFPGECVELINGKIPEALIDSAPKPGTDVTCDGAGKSEGVVFWVCSVLNSSFIHPTLSSVLMILHASHGAYGCCFVGSESEGLGK